MSVNVGSWTGANASSTPKLQKILGFLQNRGLSGQLKNPAPFDYLWDLDRNIDASLPGSFQALRTLCKMSSPFRIVEHVVPCQHIREYPAATANEQEEPLHLAVKQYIPLDNPNPQPGDVTILAAHANGFPKVWV